MLDLMVNFPPDEAGLRALLKLLEESLSLESLRLRVMTELFALILAGGGEAIGDGGIFFFWSAPFGRLDSGVLRLCDSDGCEGRIEPLRPDAFEEFSARSRIDRRIEGWPDESLSLLIAG
jgi:hypothetical protein